jgi:hypothetical protein
MTNDFGIHTGPGLHRRGFGFWRVAGLTVAGIAFAVVLAFVFGIFVQMLWNWLMPPLFHLGTITFWQAFGLLVLAKLFFGSFGAHQGSGRHGHGRHHGRGWKRWGCDGIDREQWQHYDRFWQDEGRAAFKAYVERMAGDSKSDPV